MTQLRSPGGLSDTPGGEQFKLLGRGFALGSELLLADLDEMFFLQATQEFQRDVWSARAVVGPDAHAHDPVEH